jgi:hypothetical protein
MLGIWILTSIIGVIIGIGPIVEKYNIDNFNATAFEQSSSRMRFFCVSLSSNRELRPLVVDHLLDLH